MAPPAWSVGLKLIFVVVSRAVSLLGLSRRESWWKDAEILVLRHRPYARPLFVRDPATQRPTALRDDTTRQRRTARVAEKSQLAGRFRTW